MRNGKYELIIAPKNFPGKKYRGRYAYEHTINFWKRHKRLPGPGMELHHKDGDHRNNKISNLILLTREEHHKLHAELNKKPPVELKCDTCERPIKRKNSDYRHRMRTGQNFFFCSAKCGALKQHEFGGKLR